MCGFEFILFILRTINEGKRVIDVLGPEIPFLKLKGDN